MKYTKKNGTDEEIKLILKKTNSHEIQPQDNLKTDSNKTESESNVTEAAY